MAVQLFIIYQKPVIQFAELIVLRRRMLLVHLMGKAGSYGRLIMKARCMFCWLKKHINYEMNWNKFQANNCY